MPSTKKHIRWFLSAGLLLAGAVLLSWEPTVQPGCSARSSIQLLNSEEQIGSKACAYDIALPADGQSSDQSAPFRPLLSEGVEKKDVETGMDVLVFIEQVHKHSVKPAAGFSLDAPYPVKRLKLLQAEWSILFSGRFLSGSTFHFSPLLSGIAINAP